MGGNTKNQKRMNSDVKLLTLIPYKFLPARQGGHLLNLLFQNAISMHLEGIVVGSINNEPEKENALKFDFIPLFNSKLGTYLPFSHAYDIIKIIKKRKIDAIMCSHPYQGPAAWLASRVTGIPLIGFSHNIESDRFRSLGKVWWPLMFAFEKWVMSRSQLNFFVSAEDKTWAINNYGIPPESCIVSPFGISFEQIPEKNPEAKKQWIEKGIIGSNEKLLYFIGAYDYLANVQAVSDILHEVLPRLINSELEFKILIVGKGLNESLRAKIDASAGKVVYVGFVEQISDVLDAADIMLNPVSLGGGIKTKAVEALGNNIKVVSTGNGAKGLDKKICGNMLLVSEDGDWDGFVRNIHLAASSDVNISRQFYDHYSWNNVAFRAYQEIKKLIGA